MTDSTTRQADIFLAGEGDNWFSRNRAYLESQRPTFEVDLIERTLSGYRDQIKNIVEVGCGYGDKLEQLCARFDARGVGFDPSTGAVTAGNANFVERGVNARLEVGTAERLPLEDASCDLVYFGFCLYLIDRSELFLAAAEAHRVLREGGFVAILDFDPLRPHRRAYHHFNGVMSYKQDYAQLFTGSALYSLIAKSSFSHAGTGFAIEADERIALSILHKEIAPYPLHGN